MRPGKLLGEVVERFRTAWHDSSMPRLGDIAGVWSPNGT
jgi:hypothetical protein